MKLGDVTYDCMHCTADLYDVFLEIQPKGSVGFSRDYILSVCDSVRSACSFKTLKEHAEFLREVLSDVKKATIIQ